MAYSAEAILLEEWAVGSIEQVDLNNVAEDKLSSFVSHTVQDSTFSPNTTNRAKKSLPKKLILKPTNATHNSTEVGVWVQKHIPKGTRFGPIVGEIKPVKGDSDSSNFFMVGDVKIVTEDENKTFIWNVFSQAASRVPTVIDVGDILKSNWMRYVQFAENKAAQNLVAYQDGCDIYFLAIRDIQKDEELAVWYCKEFAARVDKPQSPLEWRETCAATTNVEISIKISDKQSEEGSSVRDNESDSGYTGSPVCDQNESDENSYSENKHEGSKSCNANSLSEHLSVCDKKWHAQASSEISTAAIQLLRDLNVEITPGSKFIKLRGKSFVESIFYCLLCKSGTGLFMGEGDLVHHFQVTCKTCDKTFHGFQDFQEHMISTHQKISSNQLHQLFKEWSKDFIDEIYGHKVYANASEVDTKASDVDIKVSDVDTKVFDVHAKAFDAETKACDVDTKWSDVDTKACDVDTKTSYLYTKEADVSAKESTAPLSIFTLQEIPPSRHVIEQIGNVECASIDDSEASKSSSLLTDENMDEEVKRNQDEEIKRRSDLIMQNIKQGPVHNIKMKYIKKEIDALQQSHMEKDNLIKGKVEELKKCCQLSSIDCLNVNSLYEQAIEALQKSEKEKDALFTKLDSIVTGVTGLGMDTNVENGDSVEHQVDEMKKERKREKAAKPYCARAPCPNKGRHRCSRCKAVFYCHEDCLAEDWPHHKTFCDYVYEANKCPRDSSKKDTPETEESGSREEVD